MTRRRKPTASSAAAFEPATEPPASQLASQLGGIALGGSDSQPAAAGNPLSAAAASSVAKGRKSASLGGEAGPSSSSALPASASLLAASAPRGVLSDCPPVPSSSPTEEKRACACCLIVIAGKVFWCSRCHLVTYCGKDCQASDGRKCLFLDTAAAREFVREISKGPSPSFLFFRSRTGAPHTRPCASNPRRVGMGEGLRRTLSLPGESQPRSEPAGKCLWKPPSA